MFRVKQTEDGYFVVIFTGFTDEDGIPEVGFVWFGAKSIKRWGFRAKADAVAFAAILNRYCEEDEVVGVFN